MKIRCLGGKQKRKFRRKDDLEKPDKKRKGRPGEARRNKDEQASGMEGMREWVNICRTLEKRGMKGGMMVLINKQAA